MTRTQAKTIVELIDFAAGEGQLPDGWEDLFRAVHKLHPGEAEPYLGAWYLKDVKL